MSYYIIIHIHIKTHSMISFLISCSMFVVQAEDNERREKNLEEAKKVIIEKDPSLADPAPVRLSHFSLFLLAK